MRTRGSAIGGQLQAFNPTDLYSPVLKAPEARLLAAIAAEHGCPLLKTDTRQAFIYGDMGDDKVNIRPPGLIGGQSLFPKVMFSCFSNAFTAPSKPREGGTFTFLDGWSKMVILRSTVKRQYS